MAPVSAVKPATILEPVLETTDAHSDFNVEQYKTNKFPNVCVCVLPVDFLHKEKAD